MKKSQSSVSVGKDDYDSDLVLMDTASESEEAPQEMASDQQLVVDKVLGRKFLPAAEGTVEEFYFIKWKGRSYLHASWEIREDVEKVDVTAKQKIKRFLQAPQLPGVIGMPKEPSTTSTEDGNEESALSNTEEEEVEYYNADMVEVQRIIGCTDMNVSHAKARTPSDLTKSRGPRKRKLGSNDSLNEMGEEEENNVLYLVKWRGLSYDECTWERWDEIKPWYRDVWLFWYTQRPSRGVKSAAVYPSLQDYKKLDVSPSYGESKVMALEEDMEPTGGLMLRDYQLEGVNWLLWNWWHKRPCILADEMGLGKTIQTVCFLHQLRYMATTNINGPFLVIAPLSLVDQWLSEIATWSPDMNCVLLHGNVVARQTIISREFYYTEPYISKAEANSLKKCGVCKFHILLTTFEVAVKEIRELSRIPWEVMVIDEAHKLKNQTSRLFSTLCTIEAHHTLLLTGTPLQNKTEELWSLLNFADRKRFSDQADFVRKFGDLKDAQQVAMLHDVLRPYLLRRIKEDVEKSLPPKEETIVEVALTSVQKRFYRAIFEKNTVYLFRGLKASNQPSLMNVMMELRKCCNHPYLVRGVEERILSEIPPENLRNELIHEKLIESSGKLVLLDKLLPRLQTQGHKVLIFSQMVKVLNLLEDFLKYRGYSFERLDGTSKSADRKEAVDRFCKPSANRFVMLLSTKAGGLGLNLTAADTVIIYDSDWNPQNDLQAQARAHRIGQTKAVMVYRLLTRKTYEMQMFHQASMKLGLDRAVLAHARIEHEEEERRHSQKKRNESSLGMGTKEIDELLKRGAYDVFREDDTEQNEFVEADIDSILQRRAHKIVYDNTGAASSTLGNFSKASFVSADEKEDVDINDPDFWKKAVGLKEDVRSILDDPEAYEELPQQRLRKQTKVYDGVTIADEDQLKELLKPLRAGDKAEKKSIKALQRENAQKERVEREEARKIKLAEENRIKGDPKNWGSHGRDRVLRCLNMYGFGRWERIKAETGKGMMDAKDLEAFCRAYVLQCGLCASGQELTKADSPFVREAIRAAKELHALVQSGERELDIPPSLLEEKFLAKLRTGLARKILNKLDALAKLVNMVRASVDELYQRKGVEYDSEADLDALVSVVTPEEVAEGLELGDVRPEWARSRVWWNLACDKQLVLGVFKHGFGRYDLIRDDETLMFKAIVSMAENQDPAGDGGVVKVETVNAEDGMDFEQDKGDDNDMDIDDEGGGGKMDPLTATGAWPDPRHLNRLVTWLVTAEAAKLSKADIVAEAGQKKERKNGKAAMEILPRKGVLSNGELDDSPLGSQRSMIARLLDAIDFDSVSLVYKSQIQGLKKCEYILSLPLNYEEIDAANEAEKRRRAETKGVSTEGTEKSSDSGIVAEKPSTVNKDTVISEFEAIRLSATLILFGAPQEDSGDAKDGSLYTWAKVQQYSQVRLSEEQLRTFYYTLWLPFCEAISTKKNLSYSQHKYLVPNPLLSTTEHHYAARGLCQIFVIRQQLLCAAHFVMSNHFNALQEYLRSSQGRNVDFMPTWWCPWIHDIGLLLGVVKHGFLALKQFKEDLDLPFNDKYLEPFIRKLFINSPDPNHAVARLDIHSKKEEEQFVKATLMQFPDSKDLELRIMRILEEITKPLPADHLCRVTVGQSYRGLQLSSLADEKKGSESKAKADTKTNRSTARPPAHSLNSFLVSSRKRRKMYVASYHPGCFATDSAATSASSSLP